MEKDFRRITIVSITGLQSTADGAMRSIIRSCQQMPGAKGMLICPERPDSAPAWLIHVPIQPFGYLEYSIFTLYVLSHFINTDFALIVQDDGWVLDGKNWRSEFLDWDIIGAPIHLARVNTPSSCTYYRGFDWEQFVGRQDTTIDFVYNGGFSLRSKKLLAAPEKLGLALAIPPVSNMTGPMWKMQWKNDVINEDVQLCTVMRADLENYGIRFAPLHLARDFSIETAGLNLHENYDFGRLFGHHSNYRKIVSLDPYVVRYSIKKTQIKDIYGEGRMVDHFESLGITIEWPST